MRVRSWQGRGPFEFAFRIEEREPHTVRIENGHPPIRHDAESQRARLLEFTGAFPFSNELSHQIALPVDDVDPHRPLVEDVEVAGLVEAEIRNLAEGVPAVTHA